MAKPYGEMTLGELSDFVDDHLIMALVASRRINPFLGDAEDYVRDRLVALNDSWPTVEELEAEDKKRRRERLRKALRGE